MKLTSNINRNRNGNISSVIRNRSRKGKSPETLPTISSLNSNINESMPKLNILEPNSYYMSIELVFHSVVSEDLRKNIIDCSNIFLGNTRYEQGQGDDRISIKWAEIKSTIPNTSSSFKTTSFFTEVYVKELTRSLVGSCWNYIVEKFKLTYNDLKLYFVITKMIS